MRHLWDRVRQLVDKFVENDLLTYASAISFQVLFALVPFALFVLGLLGSLHLSDVWHSHVAPQLRQHVSHAGYSVINDAVENVLRSKQVFWATAGAVIAVWEVSGAVRAVMGALNDVYRAETERPWGRRMLISFALAVGVSLCFMGAIASVRLGPLAVHAIGDGTAITVLGTIVRWAIAIALLLVAVALLVHFGPATPQPVRWVSLGAGLAVGAWVVVSVAFGLYLSEIASYQSLFGSLASVIVLMSYLYFSVIAFLAGIQVDAMVRKGVKGTAAGRSHGTQRATS